MGVADRDRQHFRKFVGMMPQYGGLQRLKPICGRFYHQQLFMIFLHSILPAIHRTHRRDDIDAGRHPFFDQRAGQTGCGFDGDSDVDDKGRHDAHLRMCSRFLMTTLIRPATPADTALILELIRELADYEKALHECHATIESLNTSLFGDRPHAECLVAELDGKVVGFALFFHNYSTWLARPGLYLEDLYVRPSARSQGVGKALLVRLAQLAVQRNCGRFEWSVLDWNAPAIAFYESLGAKPQNEWTIYRVAGDALSQLAAQ